VLLSLLSLVALAAPALTVSPLTSGAPAGASVNDLDPGERVLLIASVRGLGDGPCFGPICVDLVSPIRVGTAAADGAGVAMVRFDVPGAAGGTTVAFQAVLQDRATVTPPVPALVAAGGPGATELGLADADAVLTGAVGDQLGDATTLHVQDVHGVPTLLTTGNTRAMLVPDWQEGGDIDSLDATFISHDSRVPSHLAIADLDGDGTDDAVFASLEDGVHVFANVPEGSLTLDDASGSLSHPIAGFGSKIDVGGDTDGDEMGEVLVCGGLVSGEVLLYRGGIVGPQDAVSAAAAILHDTQCTSVAFVDDINGDGLDDIAVGNTLGGDGIIGGEVRLFVSPFDGDHHMPVAVAVFNGDNFALHGMMIEGAGDMNDDGAGDLWAQSPSGTLFLHDGSTRGAVDTDEGSIAWFEGPSDTGLAATTGDVNGDGVADAVFTQRDFGAYVVYGPLAGGYDLPDDANVVIEGPAGLLAGSSIGVGDADGDGIDDVLVGAGWDDLAGALAGSISIFSSSRF
jgi:hypothetical protein